MGVVVQLKDVLNTIFEAKEPDNAGIAWYARVYGGSFAGILALGFLLAVSLVFSTVLTAFTSWISASTSEAILPKVINF
jgi:membrane protein